MTTAAQAAVVDDVRRQVIRAHERLRAVRAQVLTQLDHITTMSRRVSGAEASIRSLQGLEDPAARYNLGRDIAVEMEEARSSGRRAYTIGLDIARDLDRVQSSLSQVKTDLDGVDRSGASLQERSDLTAMSSRVDSMAWAVALTRPAVTTVTESVLYAEDRARVVAEHALSTETAPPVDVRPDDLTPLNTDLLNAARVASHLQVTSSDSLRTAEVATEHSEVVAEAAQARLASQQEREIPGEGPSIDPGGPQW